MGRERGECHPRRRTAAEVGTLYRFSALSRRGSRGIRSITDTQILCVLTTENLRFGRPVRLAALRDADEPACRECVFPTYGVSDCSDTFWLSLPPPRAR